jgi:cytochrome b6-f complex iron-sulfur subunit
LPKAKKVYSDSIFPEMQAGIVVLYQKCVHLGCRVPWCQTSQWFECPCHGSKYSRVGEKKGGPAPRGLDRFPADVAGDGQVTINTGIVVQGPPIGTDTTGQEAEGPHCV